MMSGYVSRLVSFVMTPRSFCFASHCTLDLGVGVGLLVFYLVSGWMRTAILARGIAVVLSGEGYVEGVIEV